MIVEHHLHTVSLIEIMATTREILFHSKHLPYRDAMFAKQIPIMIDKLSLSHSRIQLALINHIHFFIESQNTTARGHSTRRNKHQLYTFFMQHSNLIDQSRHTRNIQRTIGAGKHIATNFYGNSFET